MKQLIDFFLDQPIRHESVKTYGQASLIVICCLITAGLDVFYILISVLVNFKPGIYLMSFAFIVYVGIPFLFKYKISNSILGHAYCANFFQVILCMTLFSGGLKQHSVILPWLTIVPTIALLIINRKAAIIWFFISVTTVSGLAFIDAKDTPILYNMEYDSIICVLIYSGLVLTALIINTVFESNKMDALNALEKAGENIKVQHREIQKQADELKILNTSLNELNNNLERAVKQRTAELNAKNEKLERYAFLNSHLLRAPLARILGLVHLSQYPQLKDSEIKYILDKLSSSAHELDAVISDIRSNLD